MHAAYYIGYMGTKIWNQMYSEICMSHCFPRIHIEFELVLGKLERDFIGVDVVDVVVL
jgi:hypothetical protein